MAGNYPLPSGRTLQAALSDVMDRIYADSPKVRNELISRDRLSSQAAAARNKLFGAMLGHADRPGLGIAKYPPEKAIYRSVLERGGLHTEGELGEWNLTPPPEADPLNLMPTWERLDALFEASETRPASAEQLMDDLAAPPIGLKRGLFPLIFLHYYLLNRREIAFYDEGAYSPVAHLRTLGALGAKAGFVRVPALPGSGHSGRGCSTNTTKPSSTASGVRWPCWTSPAPWRTSCCGCRNTRRGRAAFPDTALRVRQALTLAKSPEKLLFEQLPEACGRPGRTETAGFAETLISALRELDGAYATMIDELRTTLCDAFRCPGDTPIGELRSVAMGRCHGLDSYTVDVKGLKSFMRRTMERSRSDEDWLEYVLTFLGQKPPSKWTDQDRSTAEYRLAEYAARLPDLQRLKLFYDSKDASATDGLDVILLKTLSRKHGEIDETVPLDDRIAKAIAHAKRKVEEALEEVDDDKLRLALVATIAHDHLAARRQGATEERRKGGLRRVS